MLSVVVHVHDITFKHVKLSDVTKTRLVCLCLSDQNVHKSFGPSHRRWGSAPSDVGPTCRSWKTHLNLQRQVRNYRSATQKTSNVNVVKMHQTGLDWSLQHTRTPSPYPCLTTLPLGTSTWPCASGNSSPSCQSGWRRFRCIIPSDLDGFMTVFPPSTVTASFWLLGLRLQARRATFPPPTPPRWLTRKSQGKAEEFNELCVWGGGVPCLVGGGSVFWGHQWRLGSPLCPPALSVLLQCLQSVPMNFSNHEKNTKAWLIISDRVSAQVAVHRHQ